MRRWVPLVPFLLASISVSNASAITAAMGSLPVLGICDCYESQAKRTPWRSGIPFAKMYSSIKECKLTIGGPECTAWCSGVIANRKASNTAGTGRITCSIHSTDYRRLMHLEKLTVTQLTALRDGKRVILRPIGVSGRQNGGPEHDMWPRTMEFPTGQWVETIQIALDQAATEMRKPQNQIGLVVLVAGTAAVAVFAPATGGVVLVLKSAQLVRPAVGALTILMFAAPPSGAKPEPASLREIRTSQDVYETLGIPDRICTASDSTTVRCMNP